MDITKILNTNRVILDMQATNKAEAIEELTNLLKKDGAIDCRETFPLDVLVTSEMIPNAASVPDAGISVGLRPIIYSEQGQR
ncbi:hypothetical protein BANRA_00062 [Escherichia coli]|nr:hypothetical protein BANRA_00062 [Escherichia coli]